MAMKIQGLTTPKELTFWVKAPVKKHTNPDVGAPLAGARLGFAFLASLR
jgi:hypothetical protein